MLRIILCFTANYIMSRITLPFEYTTSLEFLCGYFITSYILVLIDYTFYKIAYSYAGWFSALTDADSNEKSCLHWFIRIIFDVGLYALTYLPVVSKLLTYLIHLFYIFIKTQYFELIQKMSDRLLSL